MPHWSNIWVNEAGRPILKTKIDGQNLIIEQHDQSGRNRIWPQDIVLAFSENGKITHQKVELNASKTELKNLFSTTHPDWIYLNSDGKAYSFIELDTVSSGYFMSHFSDLKDNLLRAAVLTDLTENLHERKLNPEIFLEMLISELPNETNTVIYERMLSNLEFCYLYKTAPEVQKSIQNKLENTLWKEYSLRKNKQTALINSIIRIAKSEFSLFKLEDCLNNPAKYQEIKLSADQQNDLAYQLALRLPERAIEILDNQEKRITNPDKKAQFQFVRKSLNPEKAKRDRFFQSLLQEENREHEPWVDQAMALLNHPAKQKEALEYIRPGLDELQEIQRTGDIFFPKSWLDNLLKGHSSAEASAIVRQFLTDHPDYPESLKMKILQSADHLFTNHKEHQEKSQSSTKLGQ